MTAKKEDQKGEGQRRRKRKKGYLLKKKMSQVPITPVRLGTKVIFLLTFLLIGSLLLYHIGGFFFSSFFLFPSFFLFS